MDDRGQPVQVGAILLFGFLIIAFSTFQAVVVPQQNEEVEFEHNLDAQSKMVELRGSLLRAGSTGDGYPVSVRLGTTYPARLIAVNPGPSSGSLRTVSLGGADLGITNAQALDGEAADFWDGSEVTYATRGIAYEPNYNVYQQAPATVYENSVVYNRAPDGTNVTKTDQQLVDGRTLDLTVLQGEYQRSGSDTVSVGVSSSSAPPRTVLVNSSGDPINVSVPTGLSNATWATLLDDQLESKGGYVTSLQKTDGVMYIELDDTRDGETVTYELRIPAAGVGTDVPEPTTAYVTDVAGDGATIPQPGSQQVIAEVRNGFNAPQSGVRTCAAVTSGPGKVGESPSTDTSDEDGQVSFTYEANKAGKANVTVSHVCDGNDDPDLSASEASRANFTINVYNTGGGPGGGGGSSPTVNDLTVSSGTGNSYDVDYSVSDSDGDLTDIVVRLEESDGTILDDKNPCCNGQASSDSGTVSLNYGGDTPHQVRIVAEDQKGNIVEETRQV